MKKIRITSKSGHFKIPYASKYQKSYDSPPISTVVGMLMVLFGEEIDDFIFGYTFDYEHKYKDAMTMNKIDINKINEVGDFSPVNDKVVDSGIREYLHDCVLTIYTDIDLPIKMEYCLTMGRSNNLARVHFPFKEIKLLNKAGKGYSQYTDKNIGKGKISAISIFSKYNKLSQSFDTNIKHLRFNEEFDYDKNYDDEAEENIFLWKFKDGEIIEFS